MGAISKYSIPPLMLLAYWEVCTEPLHMAHCACVRKEVHTNSMVKINAMYFLINMI